MFDLTPDPRTQSWVFVSRPGDLLLILLVYLIVVLKIGPAFMKNRKPYDLKGFIAGYNIFEIIVNFYITYVATVALIESDLVQMRCQPVNYTNYPPAMKLAEVCQVTLFVKIVDLTETVVFVLRKKTNQISFLHLYHHCSTVLITWVFLKYLAGGMFTYNLIVNSAMHVIMYTYYLCSSYPQLKNILRSIKPIITWMQMVQFVVLISITATGFLPWCNVSKFGCFLIIANFVVNFVLFHNFYKKSYSEKTQKVK